MIKTHSRFGIAFLIFMSLLLARSATVGWQRAGTPLFPFGTCMFGSPSGCEGEAGVIIRDSAQNNVNIRDQYGHGRTANSLLLHFWRVGVPEGGRFGIVNNAYDYPLGLSWLILVYFALFAIWGWKRTPQLSRFLWALTGFFWLTWWMGSQQSRWLYPVIALGWLASLPLIARAKPWVLLTCLNLAAALSFVSSTRALKAYVQVPSIETQRSEEELVQWDPADPGKIATNRLLYVDRPIRDAKPYSRIWILR